jgi:hypothetical protein
MIPSMKWERKKEKKKMMIALLDESATRWTIEQQWVSLFASTSSSLLRLSPLTPPFFNYHRLGQQQ